MITLHQFSPHWGLSASPFCLKLETYLRIADLPYQVTLEDRLNNAPKGKMPYIEDNGQKIGDSNLVIAHLQATYGDRTDGHLSPSDRGIALAMRRLIDENLYWCLVYTRWMIEPNWQKVRSAYFGDLPPVLKQILPGQLRKKVQQSLLGHGLGRHSPAEIYAIGSQDLIALSGFLSAKPFFFGEQPTILDATAYGMVRNLLEVPIESPLKQQAAQLDNLVAFCNRMTARYYPA
jgi:glutathione S-transferase